MPKIYTFHVSLPGAGRVWRKIEMRAEQTLQDLHHAILRSYGWGGDHLYSFFMSGEAWDRESEYRLPEGVDPWGEPNDFYEDEEDELPELTPEEREANLCEIYGDEMTLEEMEADIKAFWDEFIAEEEKRGPGDVRITRIESLSLEIGKTFLYLFDYGDEWRFKVRVHAIDQNAPEDDYPKVVQSVGQAISQYSDWD